MPWQLILFLLDRQTDHPETLKAQQTATHNKNFQKRTFCQQLQTYLLVFPLKTLRPSVALRRSSGLEAEKKIEESKNLNRE